MKQTLMMLALVGTVPAAMAQTTGEDIKGNPAQEVYESDANKATTTKQATGATEKSEVGTPGKRITSTKADTVSSTTPIGDMLGDAQNLTMLKKAVEAAGLTDALNGPGPFTVFAPSDEAFEKLPDGVLEEWLKPENKAALTNVLMHHVVKGNMMSSSLTNGEVTTNSGDTTTVKLDGKMVMVGDATVVTPDLKAANGVVHIIDTVIIPDAE